MKICKRCGELISTAGELWEELDGCASCEYCDSDLPNEAKK